ncbi:hypothetical protein DD592_27130, partial [Enterobacter cloacae complex sp. 2DZ2F20B]
MFFGFPSLKIPTFFHICQNEIRQFLQYVKNLTLRFNISKILVRNRQEAVGEIIYNYFFCEFIDNVTKSTIFQKLEIFDYFASNFENYFKNFLGDIDLWEYLTAS